MRLFGHNTFVFPKCKSESAATIEQNFSVILEMQLGHSLSAHTQDTYLVKDNLTRLNYTKTPLKLLGPVQMPNLSCAESNG